MGADKHVFALDYNYIFCTWIQYSTFRSQNHGLQYSVVSMILECDHRHHFELAIATFFQVGKCNQSGLPEYIKQFQKFVSSKPTKSSPSPSAHTQPQASSLTSFPTSFNHPTLLEANNSNSGLGNSTTPAKSPYCKHLISGLSASIIQTGLPHSTHIVLVIGLPLPVSWS